jgi:diguanylate cyclase (GGDEF)-like protein
LEVSLTKFGYEITECVDGMDAWEHLQQEDAPDLIILDWSMPGLNGLELSKRIRQLEKEPQPYIILLTSKSDVNDVIEGLDSGADDYITKPFFPHELHARLKTGIRTITAQKELLDARNQLAIEASHDYLTGIYNRRAVMQLLKIDLGRHQRNKKSLCIVLFDLDHFKQVNDNYGHSAGDDVLCETTKRISSVIRPYDVFGRYGGEEFLFVLPECEQEDAYNLCERVRTVISNEKIQTVSGDIAVSISIGLCVTSDLSDITIEKLVQMADNALYKAKEGGRDRIEVITDQ